MAGSNYGSSRKLYNSAVDLAKNWVRKYSIGNVNFEEIDLSIIQAFAQHHFFSCLIKNQPIDDVWNQYPSISYSRSHQIKKRALLFLNIARVIANVFTQEIKSVNLVQESDIVLISSGRHFSDLRLLASELNKNYKILVVGKILPKDLPFLKKSRINFINVQNGRQFLAKLQKLKLILKFRKGWEKRKSNKLLDSAEWRERLWYLRFDQFPEICALINLAENIFLQSKPSLILTSSSNDTFGASFASVAKKHKIPVAEIQHGFISWNEGWQFSLCDYMLVWGKLPKRLYRNYANKIIDVGCPFFEKPQLYPSRNLKTNKHLRVLILWSPPAGYWSLYQYVPNDQALRSLLSMLSKNQNFFVSLRSHPSYPVENGLKKYAMGPNVSITTEANVLKDIKKHDIVITGPTTAGFIAALYHKPLLFFDNSWLSAKYKHPFVKSGSAVNIPLNSLEKLNRYILNLLNDKQLSEKQMKNQTKFINDYCSRFGLDSCRAIEKFLERIINGNN